MTAKLDHFFPGIIQAYGIELSKEVTTTAHLLQNILRGFEGNLVPTPFSYEMFYNGMGVCLATQDACCHKNAIGAWAV